VQSQKILGISIVFLSCWIISVQKKNVLNTWLKSVGTVVLNVHTAPMTNAIVCPLVEKTGNAPNAESNSALGWELFLRIAK
jgi:hypothetical protein